MPLFCGSWTPLQVARRKPSSLGDSGQHSRSDLLAVMEGKNEVRPPGSGQGSVRSCLAPGGPTDALQDRQNL
jgi:hypothetical protein